LSVGPWPTRGRTRTAKMIVRSSLRPSACLVTFNGKGPIGTANGCAQPYDSSFGQRQAGRAAQHPWTHMFREKFRVTG
jgi:hypothetical protein